MTPQLAICILPSEAPFNGASLCISRLLPSIDFNLQGIAIGNASIQALACEDADFDLRHVEPTRVFWCVVKLYAAQKFVGRSWAQYVIKAFPEVRVEVVQHQMNTACLRVSPREQFVNESNEVGFPAVLGDRDDAPACLGLHGHKQVGRAIAHVFIPPAWPDFAAP